MTIYTIGHSTRTLDEFVALLKESGIETVVDIRSAPSSRRFPHFDGDALAQSLAAHRIRYEYLPELGGHRKIDKHTAPDVNAFWTNRSFHNYADYAMSGEFSDGLKRLIAIGRASRTAIMCAEAVWWRCHRRIVADYLIDAGVPVRHILGPGQIKDAEMTASARHCGSALRYAAI